MELKKATREEGWALYKHIPTLFQQKTISISEFNEKLGSQLHMNKEDSFQVIKELKEQDLAYYQKNKGRILFR